MRLPKFPSDEEVRLIDLASYEILDTPAEKEFDGLVELAAIICNCPVSLITFIDRDRQWFKSKKGIDGKETTRDEAFCAHAILHEEVMIVEDALKDERFEDNPEVTGGINIRFYAGAPIISPGGHKLGTICVIDREPKVLTETQKHALELMSGQITKLLELRLKNKIIHKRAEEQIKLKHKTVQKAIQQQEKQKQFIATELHENLAQALAANRLYLQMAEESEQMRIPLIKKANENLGKLVREICRLSDSILPSSLDKMPLQELVKDLIEEIKHLISFDVNIQMKGDIEEMDNESKMIFFKIIEKWLKMLAIKEDIKEVIILLEAADKAILTIKDNGIHHNAEEIEKSATVIKMENRIEMLGGSATLSPVYPKGNILSVTI